MNKAKLLVSLSILLAVSGCTLQSEKQLGLVNSIGLLLGIAGVVLLFFYGSPQPDFQKGISLGLDGPEVDEQIKRVKKLKNKYLVRSRFALALILIGFVFQFAASFYQFIAY